jgi:hypothetical protein
MSREKQRHGTGNLEEEEKKRSKKKAGAGGNLGVEGSIELIKKKESCRYFRFGHIREKKKFSLRSLFRASGHATKKKEKKRERETREWDGVVERGMGRDTCKHGLLKCLLFGAVVGLDSHVGKRASTGGD